MIEWIERDLFWEAFNKEYKSENRYLNEIAYFPCEIKDIRSICKTEPIEPPREEGDQPGPVLRWYIRVDDDLVIITYHIHEKPYATLEFEDDKDSLVLDRVFSEFRGLGFDVEST